jgi:ParB family chromosome partitioning protein
LYIPLEQISPNPYQPRRYFDRRSLSELAESIRAHGVTQPVSVRLIGGQRYELVSGERRLRAARMAGFRTIPAVVVEMTDRQSALAAMLENLQRENLNFIEEAEGYQSLLNDYAMTQEELARRLGRSQSGIANKLRLLRLSEPVRRRLIELGLSERHARALLALRTEAERLTLIERIEADGFSARETEEITEAAKNARGGRVRLLIRDVGILKNTIQEAVEVMNMSGLKTEYEAVEDDEGLEIRVRVGKV